MESQDIEAENRWHDRKFYIDSGHWSSGPIFASRIRHFFSGSLDKIRFYCYLDNYIGNKAYRGGAKILLAPVGNGLETVYMEGMYSELHGIDISEKALGECPGYIVKNKGDIQQSGYESDSFDVVICPLFLHHVHKVGFEPFILEFYRLLKPSGILAIQEPSVLYPMSVVTKMLRKVMGNVTGLVEDEAPINPIKLTSVLKSVGFRKVRVRALSFSHVRFPYLMQLFLALIDSPFRRIWPLSYFGQNVAWYCEKPEEKMK